MKKDEKLETVGVVDILNAKIFTEKLMSVIIPPNKEDAKSLNVIAYALDRLERDKFNAER